MPNRYRIDITNDSDFPGHICIYPGSAEADEPCAVPLAWFSKYAYPSTTVAASWTLDYSFHWASSGELKPGLRFESTQSQAADLYTSNQISLSYDDVNSAFFFKEQGQNKEGGSLHIRQDLTIPTTTAAVGVGLSGAPALAMQARPNWRLIFTPVSSYWLTFGTFQTGEVLAKACASPRRKLVFPPNCFEMRARLTPVNTWEVGPA